MASRPEERTVLPAAACRGSDGRNPYTASEDEHPRPETTPGWPAFDAGGTVTAGNSSGINDGAAAVAAAIALVDALGGAFSQVTSRMTRFRVVHDRRDIDLTAPVE